MFTHHKLNNKSALALTHFGRHSGIVYLRASADCTGLVIFPQRRDTVGMDDAQLNLPSTLLDMGRSARRAAEVLRVARPQDRTRALVSMAAALRAATADILAANTKDLDLAKAAGLAAPLLDRLALDETRVEAMAKGVDVVAEIADPVGRECEPWTRPNGLKIARVSTPIGVIAMIYEARPNVTADAAALCLRSGNAVILRCGSECLQSALAIHTALTAGLKAAGLPLEAVQLVRTADRRRSA